MCEQIKKPCPFCMREPQINATCLRCYIEGDININKAYVISCVGHAEMYIDYQDEEVQEFMKHLLIKRWNTRATQ